MNTTVAHTLWNKNLYSRCNMYCYFCKCFLYFPCVSKKLMLL